MARTDDVIEHDLRRRQVEAAYRDHAADVHRVARAFLRDPDAADEATQEAFARAFERWEQYDPQRPLRAWLHGIVSHVCLDGLRRDRVRRIALRALALERSTPFVVDPGAPGGGVLLDPDLRAALEAGLALLNPAQRAALVLRHAYGYDYAAIGQFLDTSAGNVGSMLSRAHALLRRRLIDAGQVVAASQPGRMAGGGSPDA